MRERAGLEGGLVVAAEARLASRQERREWSKAELGSGWSAADMVLCLGGGGAWPSPAACTQGLFS